MYADGEISDKRCFTARQCIPLRSPCILLRNFQEWRVSGHEGDLMFTANILAEATDLSRSFADQGLKIRVRKEPRREFHLC